MDLGIILWLPLVNWHIEILIDYLGWFDRLNFPLDQSSKIKSFFNQFFVNKR
jgi:hypothetical protein